MTDEVAAVLVAVAGEALRKFLLVVPFLPNSCRANLDDDEGR
jgi:hypothetical protein